MRQAALKVQPLKPVRRAELQQLDDNQLVTAHLAETPLAFDVLVELYQARLLNFV